MWHHGYIRTNLRNLCRSSSSNSNSIFNRTISILRSEISRITSIFISDYSVSSTFCPAKENINFQGFEEVLEKGKIVVLNMNISEYKNLWEENV